MQALAEASAVHQTPGELIDDDDFLLVADDVVAVLLENHMRAQRVVEIGGHVRVLGRVQVRDAQPLLDPVDAFLSQGDVLGAGLDDVVAISFLEIVLDARGEAGDELGEALVERRGLVGWSGDDEWGAGLVDQQVVDFVDDGEVQQGLAGFVHPLRALAQLLGHVVAQVVEAVFVVGAVGDVAQVSFAAADRAQAEEAVVPRRVVGVVDVGRVVRAALA